MAVPHNDYVNFGNWVDCYNCSEGYYAQCEQEFACVNPESGCSLCMVKCDVCNGKGGWEDEPSE